MSNERKHIEITHSINLLKAQIAVFENRAFLIKQGFEVEIGVEDNNEKLIGLKEGLTACNNHYQLLEALKEVRNTLVMTCLIDRSSLSKETLEKVEQAIKNCE